MNDQARRAALLAEAERLRRLDDPDAIVAASPAR